MIQDLQINTDSYEEMPLVIFLKMSSFSFYNLHTMAWILLFSSTDLTLIWNALDINVDVPKWLMHVIDCVEFKIQAP